MAAQTAKQVIIQRLREAERKMVFDEFSGRVGELVHATVQRREGRLVFIDLGHATALLPPDEQIPRERYEIGNRYKVILTAVNAGHRGPEIVVSRSHPDLVRKLFEFEVPEISSGSVELKAVAREAGMRSKIAVSTDEDNIDPVGSCVGQRGTRVQTIISELGGEKIDIVEWSEDTESFITSALSPAEIKKVELNDEQQSALVTVAEDQLSLVIGRSGQNVRLAAKLTGWKIDVISEGGSLVDEGGESADLVSDEDIKEAEITTETEAPAEVAEVAEEKVENKETSEEVIDEKSDDAEEKAAK